MGRKTFQLQPSVIKKVRAMCRFTQDYVAVQLHVALGKTPSDRTAKSWLSMYQKIENTGKTSRKKAEKLAAVFNVSGEALQGLQEVDYIGQIESLVRESVEKLRNVSDAERLSQIAKFMGFENPDDEGMSDYREIARDVGEAIESARLSSKRTQLERLAQMFDISVDRLLMPIVVRGSWWLTLADHEGRVVSIFHSPVRLFEAMKQSLNDHPVFQMTDSATHLEVTRHGLKTRIEARNHYTRDKEAWWCEYAKCEVGDTGVEFLHSQPWDEFLVERYLMTFLHSAANRIQLSNRRIPTSPEAIFLRVTAQERDPETWMMKPAGQRDLQGQQVLREMPLLLSPYGYGAKDSAELLQLKNLGWGLEKSLHPFLKTRPADDWKIELLQGGIQIELWEKSRPPKRYVLGPKKVFLLEFMWRSEDGVDHVAPCRYCDLERLAADVQSMVTTPLPAWFSEEDVLPFEPIPDS